jgi:uncharacterized protein
MTLFWLCLTFFLLYYTAVTLWGLTAQKRIITGITEGQTTRISLYVKLMLGQWVPALAVLVLVAFGSFSPQDVGLCWFKPNSSPWLVWVGAILAVIYFLYLVLSIVGLRQNAIKGINNSAKIPNKIKAMYPVTSREKRMWAFTAVTVGFSEELIFRGFAFYLLGALFPVLSGVAVLAIATLLFGVGHLYQGLAAAVQPLVIGLLFGVFYIAFGTIFPLVLLHILQDFCAVYMVNE